MEVINMKSDEALRDGEGRGQFLALLAHELRNPLAPPQMRAWVNIASCSR